MFSCARFWVFPGGSEGEASACKCGRPVFDRWVRKIPWRRKWQPTPVFLPGKSHGWRSLIGYSPRSRVRVGHDWVTSLCAKGVWCWLFCPKLLTPWYVVPLLQRPCPHPLWLLSPPPNQMCVPTLSSYSHPWALSPVFRSYAGFPWLFRPSPTLYS